jgi:hypothetical protein
VVDIVVAVMQGDDGFGGTVQDITDHGFHIVSHEDADPLVLHKSHGIRAGKAQLH